MNNLHNFFWFRFVYQIQLQFHHVLIYNQSCVGRNEIDSILKIMWQVTNHQTYVIHLSTGSAD